MNIWNRDEGGGDIHVDVVEWGREQYKNKNTESGQLFSDWYSVGNLTYLAILAIS